ncbi:MAG: response regulator transcription factor [Myxococcota bacterium]
MKPIRVMVVDDVELVRSGVSTIVNSAFDLEVVAEAADGLHALELVGRTRPDVALVDLKMPGMDGVELTRQLRIHRPDCRVVVLTTFAEDALVFEALRAGAVGYLLKELSAEQLIESVRTAATRGAVLAPSVASKVLAEFVRMTPSAQAACPVALSPREVEVLRLVARGASNREIAGTLFIAEGTVKNHMTRILEKLEVRDRTQAALRARELGLL